MWWTNPIRGEFVPVFAEDIIDVLARCYAVVEVGGLSGNGADRGRRFEKLFYSLCDRRGVHLSERAGSVTLAEQRSASGFRHEVDGSTRDVKCVTHWELKHLTTALEKNELLIFNNKGLDYLQGSSRFYANTPIFRFLLSGNNIRDDCRRFAVLWGITVIEPQRLPFPLIYSAAARGAATALTAVDCKAVKDLSIWASRPLQRVVEELAIWGRGNDDQVRCGQMGIHAANAALDLQEQIGVTILDYLDEKFPEWIDDTAEDTWREVGGW
ncbi:hypothetical protein [Dehalococcoides mccartyi]|nr:hypothetical protein [Dehalococcoides mccartyi]